MDIWPHDNAAHTYTYTQKHSCTCRQTRVHTCCSSFCLRAVLVYTALEELLFILCSEGRCQGRGYGNVRQHVRVCCVAGSHRHDYFCFEERIWFDVDLRTRVYVWRKGDGSMVNVRGNMSCTYMCIIVWRSGIFRSICRCGCVWCLSRSRTCCFSFV